MNMKTCRPTSKFCTQHYLHNPQRVPLDHSTVLPFEMKLCSKALSSQVTERSELKNTFFMSAALLYFWIVWNTVTWGGAFLLGVSLVSQDIQDTRNIYPSANLKQATDKQKTGRFEMLSFTERLSAQDRLIARASSRLFIPSSTDHDKQESSFKHNSPETLRHYRCMKKK